MGDNGEPTPRGLRIGSRAIADHSVTPKECEPVRKDFKKNTASSTFCVFVNFIGCLGPGRALTVNHRDICGLYSLKKLKDSSFLFFLHLFFKGKRIFGFH